MRKVDIFLCYRRPGAQTAKLFKKYLTEHHFYGSVWYSDSEPLGNYKLDIPSLVDEAECAVIFVDENFTRGFIDNEKPEECITAFEIVEIAKKLIDDPNFRLFTVFLDRTSGFTYDERTILKELFCQNNVVDPTKAVNLLSQNNINFFATAIDDEEALFYKISHSLLTNEFYKNNRPKGNFYFGKISTYADLILWDSKNGIRADNIFFSTDPKVISLYEKIQRLRGNLEYEVQNNQMISLMEVNTVLSDDEEQKIVDIRYKLIEYKLFYKTIQLWEQLNLDHVSASYKWETDIYPIPNAMGMAFMVVTSDQKLLITKRSSMRKIRPDEYDCSIVEGLKKDGVDQYGQAYDINEKCYVYNEIVRAFREEVCAPDDKLDISIKGIVLDKEYGQWNLVGTIRTSYTSERINELHPLRDDTYEITQMEFIPYALEDGVRSLSVLKKHLIPCLRGKIWGMALAAIYASLLDIGFSNEEIYELSKALYESNRDCST